MDEQGSETKHDCGIKKFQGLNIARELNFTDEQYERATQRFGAFNNANQLLVALLDVSATDGVSCANMNQVTSVEVGSGTPNDVVQSRTKAVAMNSCETSASSSSSLTSLSTQATSGFVSSDNQSLEFLTAQQPSHQQLQHHQQQNQPSNSHQRHKLQRSISHQPTTSTTCATSDLKLIYIDGPNVARTHGKDLTFSWAGIKICVDWFKRRNHKVKVFVPAEKCEASIGLPQAVYVINYLNQIDALIKTPHGCNDDMFIIEAARQRNGVIVSNDLYRNEKRSNTDLRRFISLNRLPYVFDDDHFLPASDPLGRVGPSLDEFLKTENACVLVSQHIYKQSLHRTKSHQRQ